MEGIFRMKIIYIPCQNGYRFHDLTILKKGEHTIEQNGTNIKREKFGQTYKEFAICKNCGVKFE
jgi:hypothetical protein